MLLYRRSLKALVNSWFELLIAGLLLRYCDIRWFFMFCLVVWVMTATAWHNYLRVQCRLQQLDTTCKLIAIMESISLSAADGDKVFERLKAELDEKALKRLEEDTKIMSA